MYIIEIWILKDEMFKFVFFVKNHIFRHELGVVNEWIVEKLKKKYDPLWMGISVKLM